MIDFQEIILNNGLRVVVNEDHNTPLAALHVLYEVGSRDEAPHRTGFAHLFEHLMFAGSKHAPDFDTPLQIAGAENNAFTTNDQTNFYEILPAHNLETAFWLESDRMLALNINQKSLAVQRRVVVEEFKETCLNEPYGDAWHHLFALCYEQHPYRWPVIGLHPDHIEQATLEEVRYFYEKWYHPANAILAVSGNVRPDVVFSMAEKWFGDIPPGTPNPKIYPNEPEQLQPRSKYIEANVPMPAIYLAFKMTRRTDRQFYVADILSDILANGQSSRLYRRLLKEQKIFSQIDVNLTATLDEGLFIIDGKPAQGITVDTALASLWEQLAILQQSPVAERELLKIQRRLESEIIFSAAHVLNKAHNLAAYASLGDTHLINTELEKYLSVTPDEIQALARAMFRPEAACTLVYLTKNG